MSDFQFSGTLDELLVPTMTNHKRRSDTELAATRLREKRLRFIKKIPINPDSKICCPRDRRAVLEVYNEAIEKMGDTNHLEIITEADYKIRVILGITKADTSAAAFKNKQQMLSPIDPAYAEPRIQHSKDPFGYHASWRLQEWRKDGWPEVYPDRAIEKEKTLRGPPKTWRDQDWSNHPGHDSPTLGENME
jgi:hypothetical protein